MRTESYEFQPYELSFARAQFRRHVQNGSPLMSRVRVNRVTLTVGWPLPVYPDQRTSSACPGMSVWCQFQTLTRIAAISALIEQRRLTRDLAQRSTASQC